MNPYQELFSGITLGGLLVAAATLLLLVAGDQLLRRLLRRRARAAERDAAAPATGGLAPGIGAMLRAAIGPVTALLWVYGLHFAVNAAWPAGGGSAAGASVLAALHWLRGALTLVVLVWMLVRSGRIIEQSMTPQGRVGGDWNALLVPLLARAVRLTLPFLAAMLAIPVLDISPALQTLAQNLLSVGLIGALALLLLRVVDLGAELLLGRYRMDASDNLHARAVHTQVTVLRKVAVAVIAVFALASMLMVFEAVRRLGATLLASAGVAGVIVGFAAQRSIATLLAGFQIAMTQPIRVDDVVIVEGEWGRIEEITLTYVVVAIWDQRRLVLPITYFIEQPFQNWTRTSAELLGTVFLHVDYTVPLDALRAEFERLVAASPLWDGRVKVLQVTDAKATTLEVRALASAADASIAWDLRCHLREQLIVWLQRHHPQSLPRLRAELATHHHAPAPPAAHAA